MRANWKEIAKDDVPVHFSGTYVTMNTHGVIAMNRRTHERLGAPEAFHLLFDEANYRIGLKPTSPQIRNAYRALKSGRHGGRKVNALRVAREFQIDLPETMQFDDARIDEDGILILDLRTARVSPRAANHHMRKRRRMTGE